MNLQHLETQYLKAKIAYYDGTPIMSDPAFDALEKELKEAGSKVVEQVGAKRKDFDFPHPTPMKSLAKIQTESNNGVTNYQDDIFTKWLNKRLAILDRKSLKVTKIAYSPKFDGNAINIVYRNSKLEAVLTRGDGTYGKDVTDRLAKHLPVHLVNEHTLLEDSVIEIRCEAVIDRYLFQEKYAEEFANARNYVAGVIGKDDFDVQKVSEINLVPLQLIINGEHANVEDLIELEEEYPIFSTGHLRYISNESEEYVNAVKEMEVIRETFPYQLDGVVFSLPIETREILGENDHDPEWAIAIKFVPDEVVTSVQGIQWNLGKTGELTPVVQLKPVELAGTIVKKASGYNAGYVVRNKIGNGAFVSIAKAGDIIPEIQEVTIEGEVPELPSQCPSCKGPLLYDGIHLMCNNEICEGKIAKKLSYAVGMLDLKDVGGKTIEPFAKDFHNMAALFTWVLQFGHTEYIENYGIKFNSRSHEIFLKAFKNIKSLRYDQVILMAGYDGIGRKLAIQAAREYCGLTPDYTSMEKALVEKLKDPIIVSYIKSTVSELESLGVIVDKPVDKVNSDTIFICMTGSPKDFGFKTKDEWIKQFPNAQETSLSDKNCKFLITDSYESTSGKMKEANKKGIQIKTYGDFKL